MEQKTDIQEKRVSDKFVLWERKLLDLSLRNALLNFRLTKKSIQLWVSDPGELEDGLSGDREYALLECPALLSEALPKERTIITELPVENGAAWAQEELAQSRIHTFLDTEELGEQLKKLQRAAKLSLEENGANTLFLALGFLRWYESERSQQARYAPLVLMPVELVKSTKRKAYILRSRNEETQINITLLEYLRQDHGIDINGLDPLPEDEHGLDLHAVFQLVQQAVEEKKGWKVERLTFLGLFSFGQFVMWNDLRNRRQDLEQSPVVRSLLEGRMCWEEKEEAVREEELDELFRPEDMAVPLSADSSQLAAIATAAKGHSFVLHGPPGTGKSQTISNMIANALYAGKTVLFVAEKMAALSVVQNRLERIGLAPFCLELHSNKTNKTAVLGQLEKTLELGRLAPAAEYGACAAKLLEQRKELNALIRAVHEKRKSGVSLYELIGEYEKLRPFKGKLELSSAADPEQSWVNADEGQIAAWHEALREYEVAAEAMGDLQAHPLRGIGSSEYSMEDRERLKTEWERLSASSVQAAAAAERLKKEMGIDPGNSREDLERLCLLAESANSQGAFLPVLVCAGDFDVLWERLGSLLRITAALQAEMAELSRLFLPQTFSMENGLDAGAAMVRFQTSEKSWFLHKAIGTAMGVKELRSYAQNGVVINKENAGFYLERLAGLEHMRVDVAAAPEELCACLQSLWAGENSDLNAIVKAMEKAKTVRELGKGLSSKDFKAYVSFAAAGGKAPEAELECLRCYLADVDAHCTAQSIETTQIALSGDYLKELAQRFDTYSRNVHLLREWSGYQKVRQKLDALGLSCVRFAAEEGKLKAGECHDAFFCALDMCLISNWLVSDARLADFRSVQAEALIGRYLEKTEEFRKLTIRELQAVLSAKLPAQGGEAAATSELGILNKAIRSKGRRQSIRGLFERIPALLQRICPCMLMSPISVAQYIDPSFPKFDLVIFDEASQLPTGEAVGTIARGKDVVVVGDPKQLPPTDFFKSVAMDEEEEWENADLESLLDDCLALSLPQKYLKWHYRSRHESLIAYSNRKFYDNKLFTFPSPNDRSSKLRLVQVEGVYDQGKSRQNRAEAEAVVGEILRRLSDEECRKDSIGVVCFSSVQQNLIEDMLAEELTKQPELEEYERNCREGIFVKNLENVQGDERDVILFSVTYGPDADGKLSMNFGPLNREGGWRRLNVAITRARKEMLVFATLRPEQIDLSRTSSEGVAGLKGFLEYAEKGASALPSRSGEDVQEDVIRENIAEALRQEGYELRSNIGCSGYRMDIGIVDPEDGQRYLLGLMLDGKNMKSSPTAADRFSVQPSVLKGLGWELMRVWTLDWLDDPQGCLARIREKTEECRKAKNPL